MNDALERKCEQLNDSRFKKWRGAEDGDRARVNRRD